MKKKVSWYPLVLLGEILGVKETLGKEMRYDYLSHSLKVFSSKKTDEEIWEFYQWRRECYKNAKLFAVFILLFLAVMSYVLGDSFFFTFGASCFFLLVYGVVAIGVKPERKYAYLWDDKTLFMEFLKWNKAEFFEAEKFEQYINLDQVTIVKNEPDFYESIQILKNKENAFNSVPLKEVIRFFDVMRKNSDHSEELKRVQISDEDFIRFIKARFVDKSTAELNIELSEGDKSHIKVLFYNFYVYSTKYFGEPKKGKAKSYMELYLYSFKLFEKIDYTNFNDGFALDFSSAVQRFNKMN